MMNAGRNYRPGGMSDEDSSNSEDDFVCSAISTAKTNGNHRNGQAPLEDDWDPPADNHNSTENTAIAIPVVEEVRLACVKGNLKKLKELLEGDYKEDINQFFPGHEETPLLAAARHGYSDIVEYLLKEKQAKPDSRHSTAKLTPLMEMVGSYAEEEDTTLRGVSAIVDAGANLDLQDSFGHSALMVAVQKNRTSIAKYLLEKGADPNLGDYLESQTALMMAAVNGNGRLCRMLLEHKADCNSVNRSGFTASDLAQEKGNNELSKFLYIVQTTKWEPGKDPSLMQEIDEVAIMQRRMSSDKFSEKENDMIEMILSSVDGSKYLNNFRQHKITHAILLSLDEDKLKEIGVNEVGVREKLLDHIRQIQGAQWQHSSIRQLPSNKTISSAEAVCMLKNLNDHLRLISESLKYLHNRISKAPLNLRYDIERNKLETLMTFCEQTEASTIENRECVVELHKLFGELLGYTELQVAGKIPTRTMNDLKTLSQHKRSRFMYVVGGASVLALGIGGGLIAFGAGALKKILGK